MVDWFVGSSNSTQSVLLAGIPLLQVVWVIIGAIAVVILAFAVLEIIHGIRSAEPHVAFHQFGEAKPRARSVHRRQPTRS
jgi:hypothetical protein